MVLCRNLSATFVAIRATAALNASRIAVLLGESMFEGWWY